MILDFIAGSLLVIIIAIYAIIGLVIDIVVKIASGIIILGIFIVAAILWPFTKFRCSNKCTKALYRFGNNWSFKSENFPLFNYFTKELRND